jgi:signal transduction histidine kinase
MHMEHIGRKALGSWATVGFLAALCVVLAVLQFRWLGEIGEADKVRLRGALRESLDRVSREFNRTLTETASALVPEREAFFDQTRDEAYLAAYRAWMEQAQEPGIVKRVGIAVPDKNGIELLLLDKEAMRFEPASWPAGWERVHEQLAARARGDGVPPSLVEDGAIVEFPRFRSARRERFPAQGAIPELDWLVIEYDQQFLLGTTLPRLLSAGSPLLWQVSHASREDSKHMVLRSDPAAAGEFDASTQLFEVRRQGPFPQRRGGGRRAPDEARGRWLLQARPADGSLDSIVTRVRYRNLAVSGAILLLMLATAVLLVRSTRHQQKLARMQMDFVAGVSHELRTPLTVIRTAAFNLRGRVARNPEQVEKYGTLIQEQSERLGAMVEEVLLFARSEAEKLVRQREPVGIENVIEQSIQSSRIATEGQNLSIERSIPENLPLVMADESALTHAVQNLLDNAVKYGTEGSGWIGISAAVADDGAVEIRVADRGPGIPAEEARDIFDPFFRGRRAIDDQIHGTGLGLNIVKKIVEAHGGTVRVESKPMQGTAFIVKLPAAPEEHQDEFAHTAR